MSVARRVERAVGPWQAQKSESPQGEQSPTSLIFLAREKSMLRRRRKRFSAEPSTWDEWIKKAITQANIEAATAARFAADPWAAKLHSMAVAARNSGRFKRTRGAIRFAQREGWSWARWIKHERKLLYAKARRARMSPWESGRWQRS